MARLASRTKNPVMDGWQKKIGVTDDEIRLWDNLYQYASSTGILTRNVPTIDIDILNPEASEAVETLVREWFEERGNILVRIGLAPKRAVPFRTDAPFKKIEVNLIAPDGSAGQKIELLADGQQLVAFGIHKDTGKPYSWHGGSPETTRREELPYIHEAEARDLVEAAAELLVRDYGYQRVKERPKKEAEADGHETTADAVTDWSVLTNNIIAGHELHDSIRDLASKYIRSGMSGGAAVNQLRALMDYSAARQERPRDWIARYRDIPRAVDSAKEKYGPGNAAEQPPLPLIKTSADFIAGFVPPDYILDGILQQSFLYSLTGQTGAGKTSITLRLAASTALEISFANRETKKSRVLYLAAENPDDIRMRWIALAPHMGFDPTTVEVFFSDGRFTISKMMPMVRAEAERHGGEFGLVVIDTGAAFFEGDDESNRAQMGAHARMFRSLIDLIPGRPCIIVNCHPVKNATPDNLLPAGGGTFINEVDGNLTVAKTDSAVELHWQGKFRGPDFAPMHFLIKTITHEDLNDTKGRLIPTCMSEFISEQAKEDIAKAKVANENKVLELISQDPNISLAKIATTMNWKFRNGDPAKSQAQRYVETLAKQKLVKKDRDRILVTSKGKKVLKGEQVDEEIEDAA
jgi:hypothetical protein